jgi:Flp pilus assembly protein TadG
MKIRRRFRGLRGMRSERGAALVEFALVVPLLMLMMCATIDFGLAVYTLNNLTAAVREGGRFGATIDSDTWNLNGGATAQTMVSDRVYNYIVGMNNGLTATQTKALISVAKDNAGIITVRITGYPYKPLTPLSIVFGLRTISLNRTAIFRWERAT